jgi:LysM repeat protein
MKKFVFCFPLVLLLVFSSCRTIPADKEFDVLYDKYSATLISGGEKQYIVKKGDTLTKIAKAHYGIENGYYFPIIMLASNVDNNDRTTLLDPDLIEPGMDLIIPDLSKNLKDDKVRGELKQYFNEFADVYTFKNDKNTRQAIKNIASSM